MNQQIPIEAKPNQEIITNLSGQECRITIRTLKGMTLLSLKTAAQGAVCDGVLCVDRSAIVRNSYTGFVGDLMFIDTEAEEPPIYTGFNTRWLLIYNDEGFTDG